MFILQNNNNLQVKLQFKIQLT